MSVRRNRTRLTRLLAGSVLVGLSLAACSSGGHASGDSAAPGTLNVWARAGSAQSIQRLADAWNKTHPKPQVKVTSIPDSDFVTKFTAAAGAHKLPDLVSVDVVYMPQFVKQNLFTDLTAKIKALPFGASLLPAHEKLSTADGKTYGVPAAVDVSSLFWNKDLFKKAGLDPDKPPTTWAELKQDADAVNKLGNGVSGFYYSGDSTGANAFTWLPLVWASKGQTLDAKGQPVLDNPQTVAALQLYRDLVQAGDLPKGYDADTGTNFVSSFQSGKIGIQLLGSFAVSQYVTQAPSLNFGVAPIPGQNGGQGSFAGGDIMGIPAGSSHTGPAWDFIQYYLSQDVQENVVAASGALPVRTDLIGNKYTTQDPRVEANAKLLSVAQTPVSPDYNQLFNDANGPFLAMLRKGVQGGDPTGAASDAQKAFQQILAGG